MHHILTLIETCGRDRLREPVQIGVPLPLGKFRTVAEFQLETSARGSIDFAALPLSYWHDKSIKWCLLKLHVSMDANSVKALFISRLSNPHLYDEAPPITQVEDVLTIETANAAFSISRDKVGLLGNLTHKNSVFSNGSSLSLIDSAGEAYETKVQKLSTSQLMAKSGLYETEVTIEAEATNKKGNPKLQIRQRWRFLHDLDVVKCQVSLHNPAAAIHKDGHWDLGDPNSIYLKHAGFHQNLHQGEGKLSYKTTLEDSWNESQANHIEIYQESSGGENWDSPVHVNRFGKVPLSFNGFKLIDDSKQTSGTRASPCFSAQNGSGSCLNIRVNKFWQKFPKALIKKNARICIDLFPASFPDLHEIQPGEQMTQEIYLSMSSEPDDLVWVEQPIAIEINRDWLECSGLSPGFSANNIHAPLQEIIQQGITGGKNFIRKRELIDEYGWRNFGEIYADHETLAQVDEQLFASHYNNQYDPLFGFLYQYLLTGNNQWFELADDLARHIIDIDIYNTKSDRDEYNQGLFWHTDHYVPAETSTHRTYSMKQPKDVYQDHAGGGGPGGQHCYTAGLLLYYQLTGCEDSRAGLGKLTNWITNYYEGTGTLSELLLSVKNRKRPDLKNILTGLYPLDRGTGNYINALIDTYNLTCRQSALDKAGLIIRNTAHPDECLSSRHLDDVENCWFYTIFLQAVIYYLITKEQAEQYDSSYLYAKHLLLKFVDWMVEHEAPYLDKPEILEYPNTTWAAQDVRKAYIFFYASRYLSSKTEEIENKANFFLDYVFNTLKDDQSSSFSRIQSILMQNPIPAQLQLGVLPVNSEPHTGNGSYESRTGYKFGRYVLSQIKNFNVMAEWKWLQRRSLFLQRLLNKSDSVL